MPLGHIRLQRSVRLIQFESCILMKEAYMVNKHCPTQLWDNSKARTSGRNAERNARTSESQPREVDDLSLTYLW